MADICLMVLCGLPASGKSRFCHQLKQFSSEKAGLPYRFLIIEYDDLLPAETEKFLIEENGGKQRSGESSAWRKYRQDIYRCVDLLVCALKNGKPLESRCQTSAEDIKVHRCDTRSDKDGKSVNDSDTFLSQTSNNDHANTECKFKGQMKPDSSALHIHTDKSQEIVNIDLKGYNNCGTDCKQNDVETFERRVVDEKGDNSEIRILSNVESGLAFDKGITESSEIESDTLNNDIAIIKKELWTSFIEKFGAEYQLLTKDSDVTPKYESQSSTKDSDMTHICVVIDDNMYYRSMRYSYYQMAKRYNTGFCQIYLQTSVDKSLSQNMGRDNQQVSDLTITQMASRFEEPRPFGNVWEQNTMILSSMTELDHTTKQLVQQMIDHALSNPLEDTTELELEAANQSREICSASLLHQSDQILRKLVSTEMLKAKESGCTKQELKSLAERLQAVRKGIGDDLKLGEIIVPQNIVALTTDASKDESSALFVFLRDYFDRRKK